MTESDHKNLLEQLNIKKRTLQILEEQYAAFGNLYVPPYIKIQIEDARLEITELQEKLRLERSYGPRSPDTLPPGWNMPHRRNPNFSGRDTELATLKTALENSNIAAVTQAIAGLGGVGKPNSPSNTPTARPLTLPWSGGYGLNWKPAYASTLNNWP